MNHYLPSTLFDKVWDRHVVHARPDGYQLIYVDRHLMHDGSAEGFARLQKRGLSVRRPDLSLATPDHFNSTSGSSIDAIADPHKRSLVERLRDNASRESVAYFFLGEDAQGIAQKTKTKKKRKPTIIITYNTTTESHKSLNQSK